MSTREQVREIRRAAFRSGWQLAREYPKHPHYEIETQQMNDSMRRWLDAMEVEDQKRLDKIRQAFERGTDTPNPGTGGWTAPPASDTDQVVKVEVTE